MEAVDALTITQAELLEAITAAVDAHRGVGAAGLTFDELRECTTIGEKRLRALLRQLHRDGKLSVHPVSRLSIDGRTIQSIGYAVK